MNRLRIVDAILTKNNTCVCVFACPLYRDILNFLREGELPQRDRVRAVHREAQYYAIGPLLDSLEDTQPLTGEKVRQAFLDLLPYYKGNQHNLTH